MDDFDIIDYSTKLKKVHDAHTLNTLIPAIDQSIDSATEYGSEAAAYQAFKLGISKTYNIGVSPAVLDILKCRQVVLLDSLGENIAKGIVTQISEGMLNGEGITQIANRISNIDGFISNYKNQAETIARTETLGAMNTGLIDSLRELGVEKVQFVAAIDDRTCDDCAEKDMKVYEIGDAPFLPLHPNCRCTYISVPPEGPEHSPFSQEEIEKFREGTMTPGYRPTTQAQPKPNNSSRPGSTITPSTRESPVTVREPSRSAPRGESI